MKKSRVPVKLKMDIYKMVAEAAIDYSLGEKTKLVAIVTHFTDEICRIIEDEKYYVK